MPEPIADAEPRPPAQVIRLHPIRTLVISRDLAFRQRATTVLAELGVVSFVIAGIEARDAALELIRHQRPNVVVLDATGCESLIAGVVLELGKLAPHVGVAIVSAVADDLCVGLPVVPKWGWATDLMRAVQDAYRGGNPLKEDRGLHVF